MNGPLGGMMPGNPLENHMVWDDDGFVRSEGHLAIGLLDSEGRLAVGLFDSEGRLAVDLFDSEGRFQED